MSEVDPTNTAIGRAVLKARWVAERHPSTWILGVDQVCYAPDNPSVQWGKPVDAQDHLRRLLECRGQQHALTTGFAIIHPSGVRTGHETSLLRFRADTTEQEVAAYVASEEGRCCAGGYAIEGRGGFLVDEIEGCFFNVLGLPLFRIWDVLRALGWRHRQKDDSDGQ